jgi:CelD/BcsL family acetyltransferase involved in cellulose biosynthesis
MVDAAASVSIGREGLARRRGAIAARADRISIECQPAEALAAYAAACRDGLFSPSQSPEWITAWAARTNPDFIVATVHGEAGPVWAVALEIVGAGPFRLARFLGGRHANGNFQPLRTDAAITAADFRAIAAAVREKRPDIDAMAFERLLESLDGLENPLLTLPHSPSPNVSLAVDLTGGLDALLGRSSGKRRRKKHRGQIRKFEAAGGYRRVRATSPDEANRLLDAFFEMKVERFRKLGLRNVFALSEVQAFFRTLFSQASTEREPRFFLHGLEVGGKLRAVTGSSRHGRRIICEFGAIAEDELAHASPGDFLFFENIKETCDEGLSVYDFSVGDEPYKRVWCDIETRHFDVLVPLTAKGRLLAAAMRATNRAKAFLKSYPAVWRLTKPLRKRTVGTATP